MVFLIIYFIVYILDHVDHEDLPRDGFGALSIIRPSMQLFVICKCIFSRKKFLYKFHIHVSVFHVQFEHVFQVGWVP